MSEPESPFDDRETHRLFQALREHVVTVMRDFTRRVVARIEALVDDDLAHTPGAAQVAGDSLVEISNLITGMVPHRDDEDDDDDDREDS